MIAWKSLTDPNQIEEIKSLSHTGDVIIFKHSTTCSISSIAKLRLEDSWPENYDVVPFYLDLKAFRPISNMVSDVFDVYHESPQLLLIKNGECVYDASHFDISIDELKEAKEYQLNR